MEQISNFCLQVFSIWNLASLCSSDKVRFADSIILRYQNYYVCWNEP